MIPDDFVTLFLGTFRGRPDVHAVRWVDGERSGYAPVRLPLDAEVAAKHLRGEQVVGVYPLLANNTTWFLAMDFDDENARKHAFRVWGSANARGIPVYVESSRSGDGIHLWIFGSSGISVGV